MATMDVFKADGFSSMSLTAAANMLPHVPSWLGGLGLFTAAPIRTTVAMIDENNGRLTLVPNQQRGASGDRNKVGTRNVRAIPCAHLPKEDTITADDVQGIRAFGKETELSQVSDEVNKRQMGMMRDLELTLEYHPTLNAYLLFPSLYKLLVPNDERVL